MDSFHLLIVDQTRSPQCCLGPWWSWQGDVPQLMAAARQLISGPNPGSVRIFTLSGERGVAITGRPHLAWEGSLEEERELKPVEAADWLLSGPGLQLFIYNGDSDCIRHLIALKVPRPEPWFPSQTR